MENLAGNPGADRYVRRELARARVPAVEGGADGGGEVPATVTGRLGGFSFRRAWYYWVVTGPVPLEVAERLYEDPVGQTDVRAGGHCGCPHPSQQAEWIAPDGRRVVPTEEREKMLEMSRHSQVLAKTFADSLAEKDVTFSDDPPSLRARQFVTLYHIDSEVGLRIFVDAVRNLVAD
jgi:hypothetical protein